MIISRSDNDELRRNEITFFLMWWIWARNTEDQRIIFSLSSSFWLNLIFFSFLIFSIPVKWNICFVILLFIPVVFIAHILCFILDFCILDIWFQFRRVTFRIKRNFLFTYESCAHIYIYIYIYIYIFNSWLFSQRFLNNFATFQKIRSSNFNKIFCRESGNKL